MSEGAARRLRVALWWLLILGWLVTVWLMLDAMTTVPSAERLESSRLVAIPTVRTFVAAVAFSALELAVVLVLLWPWRTEFWATRMAAAVLALVTWFIITTPLDLTRMDWVHRRWIAAMTLALLLALLGLLGHRLVRRLADVRAAGD